MRHTNNTKHIRYEQYDAMQGKRERERELEIVDQRQTQRYVSRFEHPALRPRLHIEGFLLNRPHFPTQGTSTENLGNTTLEYTTPLSNK